MNKNTFTWIFIGLLFVLGVGWLIVTPGRPGEYDQFATCVADSGATFFGAFWCPHCQNQKAMFGASARLLPYEECSTPDGKGQLAVCRDAGVSSYPTWEFADGNRVTGEVSMEDLSQFTGCALPVDPTVEESVNQTSEEDVQNSTSTEASEENA